MPFPAVLTDPELQNIVQLMSRKLDLDLQSAGRLVDVARLVHLPRGDMLFQQGDTSPHFYLLLQGQLKGQRCRPDGQSDFSISFYPGEMIGELGFFDRTPRTLSIHARRDCILLEIDQPALEKFSEYSRSVYQHLIRILVQRFKRELGYHTRLAPHQFMLLQSFLDPRDLKAQAVEDVLSELSRHVELRRWKNVSDIPADKTVEPEGRLVELLEADSRGGINDRLLDDLDAMVMVVDSNVIQNQEDCELIRAQLDAAGDDLPMWLVVVHESSAVEQNIGTRLRMLFGKGFRLLHLRHRHHADTARVARHILGLSVGLVLGGGGARGFAHAGFFQALDEAGIVIDSVGGTSMGALVGALISTGRNALEIQKILAENFPKGLPFRLTDYRLPRHGLVRSKAADRVYRNAFGDWHIEDQPIPFFAVSCNLTTGNQFLYERGPIWQAVRATTSIPVFFEPHVADQQVMVDGALVNNVPVDCMRARGANKIITVDVGQEADITASGSANGRAQMPGVMKALMRVIELGGIEKSRQARLLCDYYLQPPIEKIGLMEFERREEIVSIGYEAGRRAIPDILGLLNKK
ncbi:MAG TPA: patatin-like phospholipase family protein [Limnobacter sp.]|nr:patatin-like phospholipase family protein [Limnobacter sp.]